MLDASLFPGYSLASDMEERPQQDPSSPSSLPPNPNGHIQPSSLTDTAAKQVILFQEAADANLTSLR